MNRPRPVDHVVNVSGRPIFSPTYAPAALALHPHRARRYWHYQLKSDVIDKRIESNEILRDLIVGAKKAPQSFVHISSTGVYGNARDEQEESDAPVEGASSWWADTCRRWEAAAALPEGHPTRRVALRTGVVLGTEGGVVNLARRLAQSARLLPALSDGAAPLPWIHIDDLVALVEHVLEHGDVAGVVHAVAPGSLTTRHADLHAGLVKRTGAASARLPDALLDVVLNPARAQLLRQGQRVAPSRKLEASGFRFKFPTLDAALEELMARPLPDPERITNPNYEYLHESKRPEHPPMQAHDHH